uniref:Uncharacterized protein n=1 Tax=viral metagenome TaxID=1070528 RepID=A0A6M3LWP8_9ZZZZ
MTKQRTFYQQLKPEVMAYVKYWRDDFLTHDRDFFRRNPDGRFLLAMRESGTDIVNLEGWEELSEVVTEDDRDNDGLSEKERARHICTVWSTTHNKRFFHGYTVEGSRTIEEISKQEAIGILAAL